MKLIETAALINKEIALIKSAGKKLDDRIQVAGVSVLNHVELHGDVTVVNALFLAMPKGARGKALAEWLLAHGKIAKNGDKAAAKAAPFVFDKSKKTDLQGAQDAAWYTFAPEPAVVDMFDFQAALKALMQRAEKAEKSGMKIEGADLLTKIRTAASTKAAV